MLTVINPNDEKFAHGFAAPTPTKERLDLSSGFFKLQNTSAMITHIIINRHQHGITLAPGEMKEVEMVAEEARNLWKKGQPGRIAPNGRVADPHPVKVLDLEEVLTAPAPQKPHDAPQAPQVGQPTPDAQTAPAAIPDGVHTTQSPYQGKSSQGQRR